MMAGKTGQAERVVGDLLFALQVQGAPAPVREHRFQPGRRWRFDFAWPEVKVYVEIEGGTFVRGRHVRPLGYAQDCEKYNAATLAGWAGLRFTTDMLEKDILGCASQICALLSLRGAEFDESGFELAKELCVDSPSCSNTAKPGQPPSQKKRSGGGRHNDRK